MSTKSRGMAICSTLVFLLVLITSCSPTPKNRIKAFIKAHNSHKVDRIMSFYAEDARYEFVESWIAVGKGEIRNQEEFDAELNSHLTLMDMEINGEFIKCKVSEQSDYYITAGINEVYYDTYIVRFHEGLIQEIKVVLSEESVKVINDIFQSFSAWIAEEKSEEMSQLVSEGNIIYTAESAQKWLALLREWREKNI